MAGIDIIGYIAASLVLATFCMRSIRTLRFVAIASNLAFIVYGYFGDLIPILVLHAVLLPMNIVRLLELGLAKRIEISEQGSFRCPYAVRESARRPPFRGHCRHRQ
ncbi:MAG: hypothetical protein ACKVQU_28265 [Burkholderiales bacterium]